jgi:hypothetical protein
MRDGNGLNGEVVAKKQNQDSSFGTSESQESPIMRNNNGSSIAASPFRQRSIEPEKNKIAEIKLGQIIPVDKGMTN